MKRAPKFERDRIRLTPAWLEMATAGFGVGEPHPQEDPHPGSVPIWESLRQGAR